MYKSKVISNDMVKQEHDLSCGAACARQLLLDANINETEEAIRDFAGFEPTIGGILCSPLAQALEKLHAEYSYRGGSIYSEYHEVLFRSVPFIALLDDHWIIVDSVGEDLVEVRDPAGTDDDSATGFRGTIKRESFMKHWSRGAYQAVYRFKK